MAADVDKLAIERGQSPEQAMRNDFKETEPSSLRVEGRIICSL